MAFDGHMMHTMVALQSSGTRLRQLPPQLRLPSHTSRLSNSCLQIQLDPCTVLLPHSHNHDEVNYIIRGESSRAVLPAAVGPPAGQRR